ncbi:MAG: alkaline phosphatase [Kiritimatiellae bacterium]|nr:alkaline phosphatase [Kiritimatiellia bacterium]
MDGFLTESGVVTDGRVAETTAWDARVPQRVARLVWLFAGAWIALAGGWALADAPSPAPEGTKVRHVLFIGSDGFSAKVIREGAKVPNIRSLMARGAWSLKARTILPSSSAANWASIFQCSGPELNGYNAWNSREPVMPAAAQGANGRFPDIFSTMRAARPKAKIGFAYVWPGIPFCADTNVCDFVIQTTPGAFGNGTNGAHKVMLEWIRRERPDFMSIVFNWPDHGGHTFGWGSPEYLAEVEAVDAEVGLVLAAYREAGMLESTFVVFTSDHGGIEKGHGGTTLDEMERPLVFAGPGVKNGYEIPWVTVSPDVGATLAHVLGARPERVWTGRVVDDIFKK